MVASFYFLSQGWAMETYSPFYILSYIGTEIFIIIIILFWFPWLYGIN